MIRFYFLLILGFIPSLVFAATPTDFPSLVTFILEYIQLLIPLVAALTLLVFFLGLAKFIFRVGGNEKEIENGKNLMIYGVIGLFVMLSIWGIVYFLTGEFGFKFGIPQLPTGVN